MIKVVVAFSILIIFLSKGMAAEFMWGVTGAGGAPSTLYAINPANGQILGVIGDTGAVCLSGARNSTRFRRIARRAGPTEPTANERKKTFSRLTRQPGPPPPWERWPASTPYRVWQCARMGPFSPLAWGLRLKLPSDSRRGRRHGNWQHEQYYGRGDHLWSKWDLVPCMRWAMGCLR